MRVEEFGLSNNFNQLSVRYEPSQEVLWTYLNQQNIVPCCNRELIAEITQHQQEIANTNGVLLHENKVHHIKYSVFASLTPNVFNLGGAPCADCGVGKE